MSKNFQAFYARLPDDVKAYLESEAARNSSSQNSEIIRSVRERMDRQNAKRAECATSTRS